MKVKLKLEPSGDIQELDLTEEELEGLAQELRDMGYYPSSLKYDILEYNDTENVTIVGNNNDWT